MKTLAPTIMLALAGCGNDDGTRVSTGPAVADSAPLKRMTASQYKRTLRDLIGLSLEDREAYDTLDFPAELRVDGFENNSAFNTASPVLVESYFRHAVMAADELVGDALDSCGEAVDCLDGWLQDFAYLAWRRPLSASDVTALSEIHSGYRQDFDAESAATLTLQYILQAPDFIYFPEFGVTGGVSQGGVPLTDHEVASRLSYFLWGTMPDATLFAAARAGELSTADQVAAQAWRMLEDPKAQQGITSFTRQWLDLDRVGSTSLDFNVYLTEFEGDGGSDLLHQVIQPGMRAEPEVFVLKELLEGSGSLSGLYTSNRTWTNEEVAMLVYGIEDAEGTGLEWTFTDHTLGLVAAQPLQEYRLDPNERSGLLTLSGFLHSHAKPAYASPILRGVFVMDRMLCSPVPRPPDDVPPLEDAGGGAAPTTNRDRYEAHTINPACQGCHAPIDGIGFAFENYDALGAYITTDNGYPIDASGTLMNTDVDGDFVGAVALSKKLASSRTAHDCHVTQWARYAFARTEAPADVPSLGHLQQGFWDHNGDILELLVNIAASHTFRHREAN